MKEYRKVVTFTYKNNKYNMYLDKNNKHYFLKVDNDGSLHYVTVEELMELSSLFMHDYSIMDANGDFLKEKIRIVPKVISSGIAVTLSLSLLTSCVSAYNEKAEISDKTTVTLIDEDNFRDYISNEDVLPDKDLKADTYMDSDFFDCLYIYDMDYLDMALDEKKVSLNDLHDAIDNNNKIEAKFKSLLYKYCDSVVSNFPKAELRVLYENLKTLEIAEVTDTEIGKISHPGSLGCYDRKNNKIYMLDYYTYDVGSWQYEVFFHEMSHCLRTRVDKLEDKALVVQAEGKNFSNNISVEALNSLFAIKLLPYEEKNITYQLQSNYFNVMLECMDNYDLTDYVNHSVSYFADKLDEYNNDDNYATVILELMRVQYNEYHGVNHNEVDGETEETYIVVDKEQYYPIYDYLAKMYYDKYITDDMTYDEMQKVADSLVEKVSLNTSEKYNIDYNRFYDDLSVYFNNLDNNINRTK